MVLYNLLQSDSSQLYSIYDTELLVKIQEGIQTLEEKVTKVESFLEDKLVASPQNQGRRKDLLCQTEKKKEKQDKKAKFRKKWKWFEDFENFLKKNTIHGIENETRKYLSLAMDHACLFPEFLYPKIEALQVTLAACLLIELCLKSTESDNELCGSVFSPDVEDLKFLEAEKIVEELFLANPLHIIYCTLFIRIQIYKARFTSNTDKNKAIETLEKCAGKFDVSRNIKGSFLRSYAMIFVELFLITSEKSFLENAMKYLVHHSHFAAVALWCCSGTNFRLTTNAMVRYSEWKESSKRTDCEMLQSINSISDEAAEMIFVLADIQWCIFIRTSFHGEEDFEAVFADFPKTSYLAHTLTRIKSFLGLPVFAVDQDNSAWYD